MIPPEALLGPLADQGLWIVALISVLEGPVITVLAAFLASKGVFDLLPLALVLVAGDLLGDLGHYLIGRRGLARIPPRWRHRLGLGTARTNALAQQFARQGGRILVIGKLTHSVGAVVLVAAGVARMPVLPFLGYNLVAALPKTALLMALGWFAGDALDRVALWLDRGAALLVLPVALALLWMLRRRSCSQD